MDQLALQIYGQRCILEPIGATDVQELARRIRLWAMIPRNASPSLKLHLERTLFKAILGETFHSTEDLERACKGGRGVVLSTGDAYFPFAVHTIRTLRLLGCNLPVEVWHSGPTDLSLLHNTYMSKLYRVQIRDIREPFPHLNLTGWDIKPFMLLASQFDQVILMDADSVFMQNPEQVLFEDVGYKKDGALFFKDRTLFEGDYMKSEWILGLFPQPLSERIAHLRILEGRTQFELEAGVVVLDKRRHWPGLLAATLLSAPGPLKDMIRENTHGEKETFWIGLAMADEPFSFMPLLPGSLGEVGKDSLGREELCGKLLHFDRNGEPLWFNDGIAGSKLPDDFIGEPGTFTHYGRDGWNGMRWELLCLQGGQMSPLGNKTLLLLERIKDLYRFDPQKPPVEEIIENVDDSA